MVFEHQPGGAGPSRGAVGQQQYDERMKMRATGAEFLVELDRLEAAAASEKADLECLRALAYP
ncbi:uncharacterized protein SEPMUDRAFT_119071 [Sphaerulina musiva SO2202]|uniref:Uncharacterized protein n=1 Tax=Sphaerulina musiva (strain SO2202) TaxID=692275 RepID=N1QH96_SPHMS|nr:uncharacterized protein SEPMUDRAFT_119071 [Sphaerulina musiva SO2202]EMF10528.1 hypothetical protein SEPMUDRAFT_119071 [Sphaerulina musiva SO2202]